MFQRHVLRRAGWILSSVVLLSAGCGKKGPLIYPDMLIAQPPQHLTLEQSGSALKLSFDLPDKDLSGRRLADLDALLITRRAYRGSDSISCQDTFSDLHKIDLASPSPAVRQGNHITWVDTDTRRGERYQYQVKTVQRGVVGGNVVSTALATVLAPPTPPELKAEAVFGGFVKIDLVGTLRQGAALVGYSLYRSVGTDGKLQLLASLPREVSHYEDQAVQHGSVYRYVARMSVKRTDGIIAESEPSNQVVVSMVGDSQ